MANIKGNYRTADGRAQIEYELTEKKPGELVFSASGEYKGSMGQCIAAIAAAYPNDETVQSIFTVWKKYHLNDMNAACEHQREMGWGQNQIVSIHVKPHDLWNLRDDRVHANANSIIEAVEKRKKAGASWNLGQTWSNNPFSSILLRVYDAAFKGHVYKFREHELEAQKFITVYEEKRWSGHVYPKEHPEGVLTKPCPTCGYKYGSAWLYFPIPPDVIETIKSWQSNTSADLHDDRAKLFLSKNGITMQVKLSDTKKATWTPHGHHYVITLSREGKKMSFDFWGSYADAEAKKDPTEYTILACISGDINCPSTFDAFCMEYGYEKDSIEASKTFKRCLRFSIDLKEFFTDQEAEEVCEFR